MVFSAAARYQDVNNVE